MWSIPYYNTSDLKLRAEELWKKADFIDYFPTTNGKSIGLYTLDTFYVELYYDGFKEQIKELKAITVDEALEKYLNSEDINTLKLYRNAKKKKR